MANLIQPRRDTAANWTSVNPVLAQGELGLELDTGLTKYGDGTTAWASLSYATSSFAKTGAIPTDYAKLLPFYATLAGRNSARCIIAQIGDSITEGSYATALGVSDTPARLQSALRTRFPVAGVAGGRGWIPAGNNTTSATPLFTLAGTPGQFTGWGPSFQFVNLNSATTKATVTLTGTSFDILCIQQSGQGVGYYKIDGGTAVTFNTSGSTVDAAKVVSQAALTAGSHTVEIGWSSGGPVYLEGVWEYNQDETKGINVVRGGYSGSSTGTWLGGGGYQWNAIQSLNPALIVIQLGTNDANTAGANLSSAQYKTNLQSMITNLRAAATTPPPIVLSLVHQPSTTTGVTLREPWANYATAAQSIANGDSAVVFVNHSIRMPAGGATNTYSLYSADGVHPSDRGYSFIAETFAAVYAPR